MSWKEYLTENDYKKLSDTELKKRAKIYDNINNEGGGGIQPI